MSRLRSNDACWCGSRTKFKRCHGNHEQHRRPLVTAGSVGPMRAVPDAIVRPPYVGATVTGERDYQIIRGEALDRLRHAGQVAAEVLLETGAAVQPGVTTDELDAVAHAAYVSRGAYPSTLGYRTYTKSICTSVNDVVCHGIPDSRPLADGDIVNLDITAYVDGMHGDTSATFVVGDVDEPTRALVEITRQATLRGIAAVAPGRQLREIGRAIESFAERHGYGVVREYGGHGIGRIFHGAPHVSHVDSRRDTLELVSGMCFTVEPMLTAGSPRIADWDDDWTVVTDDGLPSAQFEHTVTVTDDGVEILTVTADGRSAIGAPTG